MRKSVYFDFVRGASAQLVLVGHALNMFFPEHFTVLHDGQRVAAPGHFYLQNFGVVVFFVLSGFLVTSSALSGLRRPGYDLNSFMIDRATRIFLPFLPALLLIFAFDNGFAALGRHSEFVGASPAGLYPLVMNALMLFDNPFVNAFAKLMHMPQLVATAFGTAAPFWTVVVEWWIYVTFGIATFRLVLGGKLKIVEWFILAFALAVPLFQLATGSGLVFAWIIGMLVGLSRDRLGAMSREFLAFILAASLVGAGYCLVRDGFDIYEPFVVVGISVALLMGYFLVERVGKGQEAAAGDDVFARGFARFSAFISSYSYSLYLIHYSILNYLVMFGLERSDRFHGIVAFVIGFLACNVLAVLFWFLIERHYRHVQDWLHARFGAASKPHATNALAP